MVGKCYLTDSILFVNDHIVYTKIDKGLTDLQIAVNPEFCFDDEKFIDTESAQMAKFKGQSKTKLLENSAN